MDADRFSAIAENGRNLVMFGRNSFQRDTAFDAWKRRCAVLQKRYAGIVTGECFANMMYNRCKQVAPYCCRLQDASAARWEVENENPRLRA